MTFSDSKAIAKRLKPNSFLLENFKICFHITNWQWEKIIEAKINNRRKLRTLYIDTEKINESQFCGKAIMLIYVRREKESINSNFSI
jgi:hypothetical protein